MGSRFMMPSCSEIMAISPTIGIHPRRSISPEIRANFDLILKNVNLEARLIDDLLDLTRITRGKLHLDQHGYTLHAILRDALANVEGELRAKNLKLEVKLSAVESRVLGDSVRLQQVFWNILKNAVKFTPEGGRIFVSTTVLTEQNQVRLEVTDSVPFRLRR